MNIVEVADNLIEQHEFSDFTSKSFRIDGKRKTKHQFKELVEPADLGSSVSILQKPEKQKIKFFKDVLEEIQLRYNNMMEEELGSEALPALRVDSKAFIPLMDVYTGFKVLYNVKEKQLSQLNVKVWESMLEKEDLVYHMTEMRHAVLGYDPYNLESFIGMEFEGQQVLKVNTYIPPKWRTQNIPQNVECPPAIWEVLTHLIPDESDRKFVLNWFYNALVSRNQTFLILNGAKGIGKGILCSLARMMVGKEHYEEAPGSILTTQFNGPIGNKRVISFDEEKVDKKGHTKLKRLANQFQSIEKKGVDAETQEVYNSYIVSNNDSSDMHIESDDRRFSVPQLTNRLLTDTMDIEDIKALSKLIETDEELAYDFGYYIYLHGKDEEMDEFSVLRGTKFFDLAYHSLFEWQKFIVDKILSKDFSEITLKSISRKFVKEKGKFARFPANYKKVEDFLTSYYHGGTQRLAKMSKVDGAWTILVESLFHPQDEEESESVDVSGFESNDGEDELDGLL